MAWSADLEQSPDLNTYLAQARDIGVIDPNRSLVLEAPDRKDLVVLKLSFFSIDHDSNGPVFLLVTNLILAAKELELKGVTPGSNLLLAQTIVIGNRESAIAPYRFSFEPKLPPPPNVWGMELITNYYPARIFNGALVGASPRSLIPPPMLPTATGGMQRAFWPTPAQKAQLEYFRRGGQKARPKAIILPPTPYNPPSP